MEDHDRIELERELNEGLVYEEYWRSRVDDPEEGDEDEHGEEH